jgi:hypothetical protein
MTHQHIETITVEILHEKAMDLLRDLESLKVIRLRQEKPAVRNVVEDLALKYKGQMSKQPLAEVNKKLHDLRSEWE